MCLILFAYRCRVDLPLVLLANRDEFLDRASAPAGPWAEREEVVGGRDLVAGGSWLAAGADGRWAAVTNVRDGERPCAGMPSRGWLVRDFLLGTAAPGDFARLVAARGDDYAGFNLLLGGPGELWHVSNRAPRPRPLPPGIYGLSNGRLDDPWPKVKQGKAGLAGWLETPHPTAEQGFRLLADRATVPDHHLPETGVPLEWERMLSATFIVAPEYGYGTRSSTVLLQTAGGRVALTERTMAGFAQCWCQRNYQLHAAGKRIT